ncbi:winged helix-turn-helix domain-containing protein [Trabulsiella odontotermitis]|uniref:winged helix-turn-helix domain-containing protein n=1 Tax=Trabulsiella odontotermitis TaxID=379893 RepID=UPI0024B6D919|nr:winged helix-turn-helix domain-containing protein [Trabulsiella odontotermitis]WHP30666.1 winged helix-turn-helix domain-containing protein [Trabulsiella odontotermitis]
MSRYILNENFIFSEESLEIENRDNARKIKMTPMRARCLSLLIEKRAEKVIDKGTITAELWGVRGQFVSDANLTQLLYLLRKDLRDVGINDFIITVPRIGLRVNQETRITAVAAPLYLTKEKKIKPETVLISTLLCLLSLLATVGLFQAISAS